MLVKLSTLAATAHRRAIFAAALCLGAVLSPMAIAQNAVNTASIAPPAGIADPVGGCTSAVPPVCSGNNTATDSDTVVAPQLTLAKTANPSPFNVGVAANYTLTLTNTGTTATIAAATITDAIPAGLTIGTLPAGCTASGQTVTCSVAAGLAVGAANAVSFVIPVTPQASAGGTTVTNTATVRGGGDPTCPDSGAVDARCAPSIQTPVTGLASLSLAKTGPASVVAGASFNYTLTLTNSSATASGVSFVVQDQLPAGMIATAVAGANCDALPSAAGALLSCTVPGPVAANGGTATVTLTVTAPSTPGAITNYAAVNPTGTGNPPSVPGPACDTATTACASAPTTIAPVVPVVNFCAANTVFNIVQGSGLGQFYRYTIGGGTDVLVPELNLTVPPNLNAMMIDPVRNRLLFVSYAGGVTTLYAYDAANGGWYAAAAPIATPDFPRAGMSQSGTGYLIAGNSGTPAVWRVTPSGAFNYALTSAGTLSYDFLPSSTSSGDVAFDIAGNGWLTAGEDLYRIDFNTAPFVAVRQQRPLLGGSPSTIAWAGIAFGTDGRLYLANNSSPSRYFALTLSTGNLVQVATTAANQARDLASCAYPAAPVPAQLRPTKTLGLVNGNPYVAGAPVNPGDTLTYRIQVDHIGGTLAATLFPGDVVETLPANTTVVTTGNDFTCSGSNCPNTVAHTISVGGSETLDFVVTVNYPLPAGTVSIANTVAVDGVDCTAAGNDCTETTPIGPVLSVLKTGPASVAAGASYDYVLTVSNSGGTATGSNVIVQDQLPADVVATAVSGATCGALPSAAGALLTCTIPGPIAAGVSTLITLTVTAPATAGNIVNYAATHPAGTGNPGTPPGPACTSTATASCSSAPTTVDASADVAISKTDGSATYVPGLATVYTVVVSNLGPSAAADVLVTDNAPAGTTITGWSCAGADCPVASGSGDINQTIVSLASGASVTFTITLVIPSGFVTPVTNTATANSPTPDPTPGNNTASDTDTPVPTSDVAIVKSQATPNPALPGLAVTWTIVATNNGPSDAVMTTADAIPASVTGLTVGGADGGACVVSGQNVDCDFGSVSSSVSRTYTISGTLSASATGTLTNTATVATTSVDNIPGNNTSTSNTPIGTPANVSVVKTGPASVLAGASYQYTLTLSNNGQTPTGTNLVVQDQLPVDVVATAVTGATCGPLPSAAGALLACIVPGPIAAAGSAVVTLTVTAPATAGNLINYAATHPTGTGNPGTPPGPGCISNATVSCSSAPTTVDAPQLTLVKTVSTSPLAVGVAASYTLQVTNIGTAATSAATTVTDTIPSGLTIGALPAGCTAAAQTVTCTIAAGLAAGANSSFVIPVTPQASVAGTTVANTATASGGGDTTCPAAARCTSTTNTPVTGTASLTLDKSGTIADSNGNTVVGDAGDTITYAFSITNTGTVALAPVTVTDPLLPGLSCTIATLAPGATASCTATGNTYVITAADVTAGSRANTATATGDAPGTIVDPTASDTETTPTAATPVASLTLDKTAIVADTNGNTVTGDAGDTITYSFSATNTGTVTLAPVTVTDPLLPTLACSIPSLAPGATASCTATGNTYLITAADVTAGSRANTATATGDAPGTIVDPTASDTETTPTAATPVASLTLDKTAAIADTNGNTITGDAGDTITYSFSVTNTGTVTLAPVTVTDPLLPTLACSIPSLAPGATTSCAATNNTYVITAADVTAGARANTATATGDAPGTIVDPTASDTETTPTAATPVASLTLDKTASVADTNGNTVTGDAGDTITYGFSVTNTGTVTLALVTVTDPLLPGLSCSIPSLAPGATAACAATGNTYVITAADVTAGSRANTATATGDAPGTNVDPAASDTETTPTAATPVASLTLDKTAAVADTNGNTVTGDAGDTITYNFSATNTGSVTLAPVTIADPLLPGLNCTISTLPPAATTSCAATGNTYVITAADVTAGSRANTATATGDAPGTIVDPTASDTETTPMAIATSSLDLVKTAAAPVDVNGNGLTDAGDTIAYSFVVTNTGNTPLNGVVVTDTMLSATPIACAPSTVAVGGTATCGPASYTITVADVSAGSVDNSAIATGTPPGGTPVTSAPSTTNTPTTAPAPSVSSLKTQTGTIDADGSGGISAGDTLTYTITATNTGNVPLDNVTVSDSRITPSSITCANVIPNGTCVLTGTYVVSQADVDAGVVVNTAGIVVQPPPGGPPLPPQACPAGSTDPRCAPSVSVPVTQRPAIAATKTATLTVDNGAQGAQGAGNAGDVITYAVTVTNTGNVALNNVAVTDSFEGGAPTTLACAPTTLAPAASATCAPYTHTITQSEADAGGTLDNSVTATAQSSGNVQTVTATSTAVVALDASPTSVRVTKTATPRDVKIGDLVRYTLVIENTGVVDVVDASIIDTPPAGFSFVDNSLTVADADGAGRLAGTYPVRIDQIDVAAGDRATVTYLLRIGAGVRPGVHVNSAYVQDNGATVSNLATADVQMVADPLLDESLIVGTVFDDRDGDGSQDSAAMSGVRVQGGFAPAVYIAGSTAIDRGNGPVPQADASAPLLHGIAVGDIAARQSDADPVAAHAVVISQKLTSLDFNDDFALTTKQGVTVRMDAAGNTRLERASGDAAKGLSGAEPTVQRRVSRVEGAVGTSVFQVDYVIGNAGVDERGIPGVRIASVEGLLIETDQFGRYHLVGVEGGPWERGRNFILKVDPATLPPGTTFTTDNPLVRRVTPGLPTRFDFGAKLPPGVIDGGKQDVEMELGAVIFDAESAKLREQYLPVIDTMAEQVRQHDGGEVVIAANGESQALAYDRAKAVQMALLAKLPPEQAQTLKVSLRTDLADPSSTLLTLGGRPNDMRPVLGTVLFDTDQSDIKSQYAVVIDKVAADIEDGNHYGDGPRVIGVIGHADKRGSDAYNAALGLRRAKAVFDAIAAKLSPEARARLRVEISDDPAAPVGFDQAQGR